MHALCASDRLLFLTLLAALAAMVAGDLRMASTPKTHFIVRQRKTATAKFVTKNRIWIEPSAFGYKGLEAQRRNNYDNFLRSNIDNEQDNRNFVTEKGRDHLPFRTYESTGKDEAGYLKPDEALTLEPGEEALMPLRWNNPHASELEVNIWIAENQVVVPIRKPACAGEGHQDAVFNLQIPEDFNTVGNKVPGFNGCNKVGDCVLQIYACSVETRSYAMGIPLIIPGFEPPENPPTQWDQVEPAREDPGTDMSNLRTLCLSSHSPDVHIKNAVPRMARLVSDVFNHAYQNSNYSPYQGQQQEYISKNLQAACVLFMHVANRGELGRSVLTPEQDVLLKNFRKVATKLVRNYEAIANRVIKHVGDKYMKNTGSLPEDQGLAECFRCKEVGATNPYRQQTTTYIPSFEIPEEHLAKARKLIPKKYQGVISEDENVLGIYVTALNDMSFRLAKLEEYNLFYLPAMLKPNTGTMKDKTKFRKIDANGNPDSGQYAARQAYEAANMYTSDDPCRGGVLEPHTEPYHGDVCREPEPWHCPVGCQYTKDKKLPYCLENGSDEIICRVFKLAQSKKVAVEKSKVFGIQGSAVGKFTGQVTLDDISPEAYNAMSDDEKQDVKDAIAESLATQGKISQRYWPRREGTVEVEITSTREASLADWLLRRRRSGLTASYTIVAPAVPLAETIKTDVTAEPIVFDDVKDAAHLAKAPRAAATASTVQEASTTDDSSLPNPETADLPLDPSMNSGVPDGPCDDDSALPEDCPDQVPGYTPPKDDDSSSAPLGLEPGSPSMVAAIAVPVVIVGVAGIAGAIFFVRRRHGASLGTNMV